MSTPPADDERNSSKRCRLIDGGGVAPQAKRRRGPDMLSSPESSPQPTNNNNNEGALLLPDEPNDATSLVVHDDSGSSSSSSDAHSTTTILEFLPEDLLGKCFFGGYLDTMEVVSRASRTCRRTASIARRSVTMLDLRSAKRLTASDLERLLRRFPNASELDFNYCTQFDRDHMMSIRPVSNKLTRLRLRGTAVTDADVVAFLEGSWKDGSLSQLEEIDLSAVAREGSRRIGNAAVAAIQKACPCLRSLKLGWCKNVSDESISNLRRLTRLEDLDLSLTSVTSEACRDLFAIKSLRTLDVSATNVGGEGIRNLLVGHHAERPPRLETLILCHNQDVPAEALATLAIHADQLKHLGIRNTGLGQFKDLVRRIKRNGTTVVGAN